MAEEPATDSPLEAAAGAAGERATEAFSVLGNETRLSILLALWEAYEPFVEDNAVPFSELRERVGMRDSGQFNYHLDRLAGHFVRKTEDGYELRHAGHQLVRTVIAGTGIEAPTLEPTETDGECNRCGAPTAVTYQDGRLYLVCTECDGNWRVGERQPVGALIGGNFDPAGLTDRQPERLWTAMTVGMRHAAQSGIEGVCEVCSGPTETSLDVCTEHGSDGLCEACGREWALAARSHCHVCKNSHTGPPYWYLAWHPVVVAFYYERGVSLQYDVGDHLDIGGLAGEYDQELVADDPPRVQVTYRYEGDRLELLVDEELTVLETTTPD